MRQQRNQVFAAAKIKQDGITQGPGVPTAAVPSVGLNRQDSGGRFDPFRRFHLDRQTVFVTGPVDPNLIGDHQHRQ